MRLAETAGKLGKAIDNFLDKAVDTSTPLAGGQKSLNQDGGFYGHLYGGQKGKPIKGGQEGHCK